MKMHIQKGLVTVVGIAALAFGAWYFYSHTKRFYAKQIIKLGGTSGSIIGLMSFEEGYLKAWGKGLVNGKDRFVYQGKSYNTTGGKIV